MNRNADTERPLEVLTYGRGSCERRADAVVVEAPLEVRLNGEPFAVIMRTPGDDEALALGFLLSESVIASAHDVADLVCWPGDPALGNRLNIVTSAEAREAADAALAGRRRVTTSSACGLCGRLTLETLRREGAPLPLAWTVPASVVSSLPSRLRRTQRGFDVTGALHAAALFARDGELVAAAEDVGRHNAVDKVIGRMLAGDRLPLDASILAVSGRVSFEIVQKALLAGVPLVAAVSAPTSLAVEAAEMGGLTLAAFVRGDTFNVYSWAQRISD